MTVTRLLSTIALLMIPVVADAGSLAFYTARFDDKNSVSLSILSSSTAADSYFDFDVAIALQKADVTRAVVYTDRSHHKASVRCSAPAEVMVRGVRYPISTETDASDWKRALFRTLCDVPVS
ncbi:MAG: hypothetical protein JWM58_4300 [Rhizobium sp.]|nr:hypothetical protein [Rhizobium sp.]